MMIKMNSEKLLYEGKAKSVFQGENDDEVIIKFRDDLEELHRDIARKLKSLNKKTRRKPPKKKS